MALAISEEFLNMMRAEVIRVAIKRRVELIPWPDTGVLAIDAGRDAYTLRFWRPSHEGPVTAADFIGRVWLDAEALLIAKRHSEAFAALVRQEMNHAIDAYEREARSERTPWR
jgi:hypothetical protein